MDQSATTAIAVISMRYSGEVIFVISTIVDAGNGGLKYSRRTLCIWRRNAPCCEHTHRRGKHRPECRPQPPPLTLYFRKLAAFAPLYPRSRQSIHRDAAPSFPK